LLFDCRLIYRFQAHEGCPRRPMCHSAAHVFKSSGSDGSFSDPCWIVQESRSLQSGGEQVP
jgi:hypothetical protein